MPERPYPYTCTHGHEIRSDEDVYIRYRNDRPRPAVMCKRCQITHALASQRRQRIRDAETRAIRAGRPAPKQPIGPMGLSRTDLVLTMRVRAEVATPWEREDIMRQIEAIERGEVA